MDRAADNPVHGKELYHPDPSVYKDTPCCIPAIKEDMHRGYQEHGDAHGGKGQGLPRPYSQATGSGAGPGQGSGDRSNRGPVFPLTPP